MPSLSKVCPRALGASLRPAVAPKGRSCAVGTACAFIARVARLLVVAKVMAVSRLEVGRCRLPASKVFAGEVMRSGLPVGISVAAVGPRHGRLGMHLASLRLLRRGAFVAGSPVVAVGTCLVQVGAVASVALAPTVIAITTAAEVLARRLADLVPSPVDTRSAPSITGKAQVLAGSGTVRAGRRAATVPVFFAA